MTQESIKEDMLKEFDEFWKKRVGEHTALNDKIRFRKLISSLFDRYAKAYALSCIPERIYRDEAYRDIDQKMREMLSKSDLQHFVNGYKTALSEMRSNVNK